MQQFIEASQKLLGNNERKANQETKGHYRCIGVKGTGSTVPFFLSKKPETDFASDFFLLILIIFLFFRISLQS
jgi:hypothetical protein